jgi:hypothetical protein
VQREAPIGASNGAQRVRGQGSEFRGQESEHLWCTSFCQYSLACHGVASANTGSGKGLSVTSTNSLCNSWRTAAPESVVFDLLTPPTAAEPDVHPALVSRATATWNIDSIHGRDTSRSSRNRGLTKNPGQGSLCCFPLAASRSPWPLITRSKRKGQCAFRHTDQRVPAPRLWRGGRARGVPDPGADPGPRAGDIRWRCTASEARTSWPRTNLSVQGTRAGRNDTQGGPAGTPRSSTLCSAACSWPARWTSRTSCTAIPGTPILPGAWPGNSTTSPLVLSTHSLEPHSPWKREQLGSGYDLTTWIERTAYQHRGRGHCGVRGHGAGRCLALRGDPGEGPGHPQRHRRARSTGRWKIGRLLARYGLDPDRPYLLFVGRITRQKGIVHLLQALRHLEESTQVMLCASSPDTEEIGKETESLVAEARRSGVAVVWERDMVPRADIVPLYSQAAPCSSAPPSTSRSGSSTWRPWPAARRWWVRRWAASPRSVLHGKTGLLVPFAPTGRGDPGPAGPGQVRLGSGRGREPASARPGHAPKRWAWRPGSGSSKAFRLGRHRRPDAALL